MTCSCDPRAGAKVCDDAVIPRPLAKPPENPRLAMTPTLFGQSGIEAAEHQRARTGATRSRKFSRRFEGARQRQRNGSATAMARKRQRRGLGQEKAAPAAARQRGNGRLRQPGVLLLPAAAILRRSRKGEISARCCWSRSSPRTAAPPISALRRAWASASMKRPSKRFAPGDSGRPLDRMASPPLCARPSK